MYFEEVDWFWRLNLYCIKYDRSENLAVHHYQHGSTEKVGQLSYRRFLWRNTNVLIMLYKNLSPATLFLVMPLYFLSGALEALIFALMGQLEISKSYFRGWRMALTKFSDVSKQRKIIQQKRKVSDLKVMKKLYIGSAKISHIFRMIAINNESL
jgi:GT2 family glycosyltransferase